MPTAEQLDDSNPGTPGGPLELGRAAASRLPPSGPRQVTHFVSRESAGEFAAGRSTCLVVELSELRRATERFHPAIWSALET